MQAMALETRTAKDMAGEERKKHKSPSSRGRVEKKSCGEITGGVEKNSSVRPGRAIQDATRKKGRKEGLVPSTRAALKRMVVVNRSRREEPEEGRGLWRRKWQP